jgi:hypothetical protein
VVGGGFRTGPLPREMRGWLGRIAVPALLSLLTVLAACSAGGHSVGRTSPTHPSVAPATTGVASTTTTETVLDPTATLGQPVGIFFAGMGFGQIRPSVVFNGGDPTGYVGDVAWKSWGASTAVGTGMSDWVGPHQAVAQGTQEPVIVVAFHLGVCDGKTMYQAVEWFFPQHGQRFNPNQYENICTGTYVPSS